MNPVFPDAAFVRRWAIRISLVWIAIFYARVAWVSRDEHRVALEAERRSSFDEAVAHHRRAARHVAPPLDSASASIDALFRIAGRAERAGDDRLALSALRSIRGSIHASRSFVALRSGSLARADRDIARIVSRIDRSPEFRDRALSAVAEDTRRGLESVPGERVVGVALAVLGFLAFLHAAHRLLTRDVGIDDRWNVTAAKESLARLLVAFVAFVVGLFVA